MQGHGEGETQTVPEARAVPPAAQGARLAAQAAGPSPTWGTAGPPAGRPAATAAHHRQQQQQLRLGRRPAGAAQHAGAYLQPARRPAHLAGSSEARAATAG